MNATQSGQGLQLKTDPVRDCNGNAVPDGTIVTFTEAYEGGQTTVDVPLKRGIAEVGMASHNGAIISVASGVVLGNQIRWRNRHAEASADSMHNCRHRSNIGFAQAAVRVEPPTLQGPRPLTEQTSKALFAIMCRRGNVSAPPLSRIAQICSIQLSWELQGIS